MIYNLGHVTDRYSSQIANKASSFPAIQKMSRVARDAILAVGKKVKEFIENIPAIQDGYHDLRIGLARYEGFICQNKIVGKFKILVLSGEFEGYINGNFFEGMGLLRTKEIHSLECRFEDGFPKGKFVKGNLKRGKVIYGNKYVYEGRLNGTKREGPGKLTLPHLTCEGQFKDDQLEGAGKLIFNTGHIYEGTVDNNFNLHGQGKTTYPNKDIYEGEYQNGQRHGPGILHIFQSNEKTRKLYANDVDLETQGESPLKRPGDSGEENPKKKTK